MKKLIGINRDADAHWVGNGFPVRTIFSFQTLGQWISPFLLLDYAGPAEFPPSDEPRGVGEHPHRGFETVTDRVPGRARAPRLGRQPRARSAPATCSG